MTIETLNNRTDSVADGITNEFEFNYLVLSADHMVVFLDGTEFTGGVTVAGVGDLSGGSVTLSTTPAADVVVTCLREVPLTQKMSYPTRSAFPSQSHESALDWLTMISQQQEEQLDRCLKQGILSDPGMDYTFPTYSPGAGLMFDPVERKLAATSASLADLDASMTAAIEALADAENLRAAKMLTISVTYSVGASGDYSTLNEALEDLSKKAPAYKVAGVSVTLELQAGFVMQEQVLVRGLDMSWVTITGVDAETTIDHTALTSSLGSTTYGVIVYPAFGVSDGGGLVKINQLFRFSPGAVVADQKSGIVAIGPGSRVEVAENCGVQDAGNSGLFVTYGALAVAVKSKFTGAGSSGVFASLAATAVISESDLSGAEWAGIYATHNACVYANSVVCSNSATYGVYGVANSIVSILYADLSNCGAHAIRGSGNVSIYAYGVTAINPGSYGIHATNSSTVNAVDATITGAGTYDIYVGSVSLVSVSRASYATTSQAVNTWTANGFIGG